MARIWTEFKDESQLAGIAPDTRLVWLDRKGEISECARKDMHYAIDDQRIVAFDLANRSPPPTDNNPKTAYGDKKASLHLVPASAIIAEAGVFKLGASKYGPFNWREKTVSATVYQSAALRHLLAWFDGQDNDPESGESHLAHARACLGILIDAQAVGNLNDNRPPKGAAAKLLEVKP